ncbi:MAG TPA: histidine triad nucleotide-binding protein [Anaerolineales bacterium]
MTDCIFCRIITGEAPAEIVYTDQQATAFRDVRPVALTHILIVPNKHIASVNDLTSEDEALVGHLFGLARQIAQQEGVDQSGYRLIVNTGQHAGQVVFHLHLHLIGGQRMRFPMG